MKTLSLGYSPCPNDTFIFYALAHGKVHSDDLSFKEVRLDIETLNQKALKAELDLTKLSYHAFGNLRDEYCLLRSGGALGKGCGPLLVVRSQKPEARSLRNKKIAIPGELTTAYLLLKLYIASDPSLAAGQSPTFISMPFNEIMEAVKKCDVDAGLIIHESRFTYPSYGLKKVIDLGEWWEKETGLPIPLGCIAAKRSLGEELINKIDGLVRESVVYAMTHRDEPRDYIKSHSQELEDKAICDHINLYVNDLTIDIGEEGIAAVKKLFEIAEEKGIIKNSSNPLFFSET